MTQKITVIRGDGIGPEIMDATLFVLDQLKTGLEYEDADAGLVALEKHGDLMPAVTLESIARNKVALKSPLTTPVGGGFTSINVSLRRHFDLYANVRPAHTFPNTKSRFDNVDLITVRENTEGAYLAEGQEVSADGETAFSGTRITRKGSERIVRYAFELARSTGRKKVTAVHKANIIKSTSGLFLAVAREVAAKYPDIEFQEMIVDNCCMQLVMRPEQFDVIVTTNLFGDIISDLCAGLVGGLGLARAPTSVRTRRSSKLCTAPRRTSPARARPIRAPCCWQRRRCWTMSASRKMPSACARPSWPRWKPRIR